MANYYASARTSYAKMKDDDAFKEWADSLSGAEVIWKDTEDYGRLYGFLFGADSDYGGISGSRYDEESDEMVDLDIYEELQPHLADGWAITFVEAGAEKLRYVMGFAAVLTNTRLETLSLDDFIGRTLTEWGGPHHTRPEY